MNITLLKKWLHKYTGDIPQLYLIGGTVRDMFLNIPPKAIELNRDGSIAGTIDPLNGAQDISNRIIKAVRQDAFASDPLRIIRAFRFSATLNFDIEDLTLDHIRKNVELLILVSGERILSELLLILGTTNSTQFIKQMDQFGILAVLFPEIRAMKGCSQNAFHHKDVWDHSLLVMEMW